MDGSILSPNSAPDGETLPRHRWNASDVARMIESGILPEKARVELIGGELIDMPSEGGPHWEAKTKLVNWLIRRLPEETALAPDGPLRLSETDEPEPDFFLFPERLSVNDVRGPDCILVVEIADSSVRKDKRVKTPLYARYGVRAYWIVDLNARETLAHQLASGAYAEPERIAFDAPLAAPGVAEPLILAQLL